MIKEHYLTKDERLVIYQDTTKNCYTFDTLLLSYFTNIKKKTNKIVDLCSGNAPIAMLLAGQKKTGPIHIKAIEIQQEMAQLAQMSIDKNNLNDQVEMINADLIGINKQIGANMYDLVTCNPPYFKIDKHSNLNQTREVTIARHELLVNIEQIINEARILLNNQGSLVLVFRPERLDELIIVLNTHGLKLKRLQFVYPKDRANCNTILVEAKKGCETTHLEVLSPLYIYDQIGNYTKDALEIVEQ